jgi:hypothetical protein
LLSGGYTGRDSTAQISDEDAKTIINDYYINHWPNDAQVDEFDTFFTQALSATDDGVYDLNENVDRLDDPVTINGSQIRFYRDREAFFSDNWHLNGHHHHFLSLTILHNTHFRKFEDEQFITEPTLVIGSSDSKKVKHSDFDYNINDFAYSKPSSEVDLTGSAVPQGKYGAWSLKIDTNGDITVAEATANSTGYDTPRLALEALSSSDSESAYMGYVTVIKSDGAFTPATTALDASNVTATFTDGRFEGRTTPVSALLYGQKLYVFPKPNDIYQLKALQIAERPTELGDSDAPADAKHGPAIPLGAAILFMKGNEEPVDDGLTSLADYFFKSIRSDKNKRLLGGVVQRRF